MADADSDLDVAAHLVRRAHDAGARGRESMVTRCAWCGRFDADGRWTRIESIPAFFAEFVDRHGTHGICPDCMRRLEHDGETVPLH